MKPITLLLLMSSLVIAASGALAQEQGYACSNQYGACMDRCSSRSPSLQGSCAQSCETTSNQCYQSLYGPSPLNGLAAVPSSDQAPPPEASDARDDARAKPNSR